MSRIHQGATLAFGRPRLPEMWQPWKHHRVTGRTAYACGNCGNQVYPLAGTIFAKSRMPLKKWFYAIYLMGSTDWTITAKQLQWEIGVTYKTAWRVSRSIRQLMALEAVYRESSQSQLEASAKGGDHTVGPHPCGMPLVGETNPCESTTVRKRVFSWVSL